MNRSFLSFNYFYTRVIQGLKNAMKSDSRLARLLAAEGVLFSLIFTMCNNNNNLYASRLGATSSDLGLIASLPPIVGMVFLIPFAIITDRMKNRRSMVLFACIGMGLIYVLVGMSAFFISDNIMPLIILLIIVNFPISLYHSSWQSFFSEVSLPSDRNDIYAYRTRMNTAVGIIFPLIFGVILTLASGQAKITVHQIYYFLALPLAIGQVFLLKKISYSGYMSCPKFSFKDLTDTVRTLFRDKSFLGFIVVAFLVFAGWQMDWSLYFQAQFFYLELNETQLSLVAVIGALTQFVMLGTWSRVAAKKGVRFVFFIGASGFAFNCFIMVFSLIISSPINIWFYYIFHSIGSSAFSAFQFSLLLCLLEVIPNINRTLSIAIYSVLIMISNIIMPYLGVYIYNGLGENHYAMVLTMIIVGVLRLVAAIAAFIRWYIKRNDMPQVMRFLPENSESKSCLSNKK